MQRRRLNRFSKKGSANKAKLCFRTRGAFLAIVAVLTWPWLFYGTRPATKDNSYQVRVEIDRVEVVEFLSGPTIYIYTEDRCYECDAKYTSVDREGVAQVAADRIRCMEGLVTLTVLEFHPRHPLHAMRADTPVESRVVGLQNDTEILWTVDAYNSSQRFMRAIGICVCTVLSVGMLLPFYFLVLRRELYHLKVRGKKERVNKVR